MPSVGVDSQPAAHPVANQGGGTGSTSLSLPLPAAEEAPNRVVVNSRLVLQDCGGLRLVQVCGMTLYAYRSDDRASELIMAAALSRAGVGERRALAKAIKTDESTLYRTWQRLEQGGVEAVRAKRGRPTGTGKVGLETSARIQTWLEQGKAPAQMALELGVAPVTVRRTIARLGLKADSSATLPWTEAPAGSKREEVSTVEPAVVDAAGATSAPTEPTPAESAAVEPALVEADAMPVTVESAVEPTMVELVTGPRIAEEQATPVLEMSELIAADSPRPAPADIPDRSLDRILAWSGVLVEAKAEFINAREVPNAGVLLALPVLTRMGIFAVTGQVYGALNNGYYGLMTVIWTFLAMALLRIKNIEQLAQCSPLALGWVLGLDRGPEVKTLRRKLGELASAQKAHAFLTALAERRVEQLDDEVLALLYVDGHVREYHGKHKLSKGYVTQRRLAMPATTDYWMNVRDGTPLLVVTAPMNEGLSKMMPVVIEQAQPLLGGKRPTVVFDRGGYDRKLFAWMLDKKVDLLTYWKGSKRKYRPGQFKRVEGEVDGRKVEYDIYEGVAQLAPGLRLRVVAVRREDGRQTLILTSRKDMTALEVAYWMFSRWRQENYFKYMGDHFELDALVDHRTEALDEDTIIVNPKHNEVEKDLRARREELASLRRDLGELVGASASAARIEAAKLALQQYEDAYSSARDARRAIPKHISIKDLSDAGGRVRLSKERKLITDVLKTAAYNAETMLLTMIAPHYARGEDEGRALLRQCLAARGDLVVKGHVVHVVLEPMSAARQTLAIAALCAQLNKMNTTFPGSQYRLHYAVRGHE